MLNIYNKLVNEKINKLSGMVDKNWLERNENFLKLVLLIPFGIASFLLNEGGEHRLALMVGGAMIFILASFFDTLVHGKNGSF